jgi:hypothetical protein
MRGQAMLAVGALAAALAVAQPAAAQNYGGAYASPQYTHTEAACRASQNRRMAGGAIIGAIAGAVIGNNVASGGRQGDGSLLGAALGGAAGAAIGRSTACRAVPVEQGYNQPYQAPYQADPYQQGHDDLYGGPYRQSSYHGGGYGQGGYGRCEWQTVTRYDRRGRAYPDDVQMCQGRDGVWREAR